MNENNIDIDTDTLIEAQNIVPADEELAISISLQRHDVLCLIGPDSARLCHYLRTLAGVKPPHNGELKLFGRSIKTLDRKSWREQRQYIGYVAHNAPILSVLNGIDNVMLPALYHKRMSRDEAEIKAMELITQVGFNGDINKLPAYLNQQQRLQLAIARATILDPVALFVENPFSSLSLAEQQPIYHYLVNSAPGRALALATHNLHLVRESATQILFISEQQVEHFHSWKDLSNCQHEEIVKYLQQYQQQYQQA